jgi:hypothetical protein
MLLCLVFEFLCCFSVVACKYDGVVYVDHVVVVDVCIGVPARMLVPKMVKNGFNSVLQTSAGSRRLVAQEIQEQIRRPKTALKS